MSLSTHVLDAVEGRSAAGLDVALEVLGETGWRSVTAGCTDGDGRIAAFDGAALAGTYRLVFATGAWSAAAGRTTFYPEVVVTFAVTDPAAHHHVPLLLSPFAYSTYRGS